MSYWYAADKTYTLYDIACASLVLTIFTGVTIVFCAGIIHIVMFLSG